MQLRVLCPLSQNCDSDCLYLQNRCHCEVVSSTPCEQSPTYSPPPPPTGENLNPLKCSVLGIFSMLSVTKEFLEENLKKYL